MTVSAHSLCVLAAALVIAGCAVPPRPDAPRLRHEAPLAGLAAPQGGAWPDPQWWTHYRDKQLDTLERMALATAPSIDEAHKRFNSALRSVDIARAAGGASVQANAQVQRQRLSEHGLIPSRFLGFTWYNQGDLNLQFQYDFDFWGKQRAAVAAAVDEAHAAAAERSAAALMLTSAVADTYFGWQADEARRALARDTLGALERSRRLVAQRAASGIEAPDTLHEADAQIAAAREREAGYAGSAEIRRAALVALLGVAPKDVPTLITQPLPPVEALLPAHAGIDLLARRPDIAASRWRVEAAMQRVDQARAAFYPDISLGAMAGLSSIDLDKLLTAGSRVAGFGPALHLPLFDLRNLHAAYGASQAQLDAAASQYDAAVVDAARDVATQALTLEQIDARRHARADQLAAAQALRATAAARVRRGVSDERSLLAAEAHVLDQRDAATTLHAQALAADIALTKALGGGYRMQQSPAATGAEPSTSLPPTPRAKPQHPPSADRAPAR